MRLLAVILGLAWIIFAAAWIAAGIRLGFGHRNRRQLGARGILLIIGVVYVVALHFVSAPWAVVHSVALQVVGIVLFATGLAVAIWARVLLGRNWGLPGSTHDEPTLVTGGPYRLVRHPIYSGLALACLGTALALDLLAVPVFVIVLLAGTLSARSEERTLTQAFPEEYPAYRRRTRMLIPYVF